MSNQDTHQLNGTSRRRRRGLLSLLAIVSVAIIVAAPASARLGASWVDVECPDHATHVDYRDTHGVLTLENTGRALADAGQYRVDPADPVLQVSGRTVGDGYGRIFTVVVNGQNLGNEAWYQDPYWHDECNRSYSGIVRIIRNSVNVAFDLSEVLPVEELLAPVDVQIGVSTFVGHWELTVQTTADPLPLSPSPA